MKISDVEATGSGWGRAEASEAKAQVAGYRSTAHGRAAGHGARAGQGRNGIFC